MSELERRYDGPIFALRTHRDEQRQAYLDALGERATFRTELRGQLRLRHYKWQAPLSRQYTRHRIRQYINTLRSLNAQIAKHEAEVMITPTPGPWIFEGGIVAGRRGVIVATEGNVIIADWNHYIPEGRANAALISASPDLFAALEGMLDGYPDDDDIVSWAMKVAAARAALAKARGEDG